MTPDTYSISDLARLTGVNVRTIRYYLAQGLLPASGESGPGAHYGEGHLDRLRLTRRLQQQHLPLAEIRRRLAELTDGEVGSVLATSQEPSEPSPTTSALDYVRAVLGKQGLPIPSAGAAAAMSPAAMSPGAALAPSDIGTSTHMATPAPARLTRAPVYARMGIASEERDIAADALAMKTPPAAMAAMAAEAMPAMPAMEAMAMATASNEPAPTAPTAPTMPSMRDVDEPARTEPPGPERSQWERLSLGPNIELHIRRPLGRLEQRRVERLLTIARQVLKEEAP